MIFKDLTTNIPQHGVHTTTTEIMGSSMVKRDFSFHPTSSFFRTGNHMACPNSPEDLRGTDPTPRPVSC